MRMLNQFFVMQCVIASRSKQALFWSFMYPLFMLVLFLSVLGGVFNHQAGDASDQRLMMVAGVFVITIMSGGIFAIATVLSADYDRGVYKRFKLTDLSKAHIVTGLIMRQLIIVILGIVLVAVAAKLLFSAGIHGQFFSLLLIIVLGTILFSSIGFLIANVCDKPQTAAALANVLFLVMMFLSGSSFPKAFFPDWLSVISSLLPASYLYDLIESQVYYNEPLSEHLGTLGVLAGMTIISYLAAIKTFKWE